MIELNLLPDIKKEFLKAQRTRNTVISGAIIISIVAGAIVVLLATTVYGGQSLLIKNLNDEISKNHKTLASKQEINKYLAIQSQLKSVDDAAKTRSSYARLFDYLQQLNPATPFNVTLFDLNLAKDTSTITMSGSANNFEAVNNFRATLERAKFSYTLENDQKQEVNLFTNVTNNAPSLSTVDGKVIALFDFTVTFSAEAFDPSIEKYEVIVPKLVTSDGDRNAPKELFGEAPKQQGGTNGQ